MSAQVLAGTAAVVAGLAGMCVTVRAWPARERGRHRTPGGFTRVPSGARWLPCHTTMCGHMTTRHTPHPDSTYTCTGCGTTTQGDS